MPKIIVPNLVPADEEGSPGPSDEDAAPVSDDLGIPLTPSQPPPT